MLLHTFPLQGGCRRVYTDRRERADEEKLEELQVSASKAAGQVEGNIRHYELFPIHSSFLQQIFTEHPLHSRPWTSSMGYSHDERKSPHSQGLHFCREHR